MGRLRPTPHVGGVHEADMPAPPGDSPVKVRPDSAATWVLLLTSDTGALFVVVPFSSVMSASRIVAHGEGGVCPDVHVVLTLRVADVSVAWLTCKRICTGRQPLKSVDGELTVPTLAMIPARPGAWAVTNPLTSTVATLAFVWVQVIAPTWLVISRALGPQGGAVSGVPWVVQAWAVNCSVSLMEKQAGELEGVVTTTEVTCGWSVTCTGALVMFCALAVIVALPDRGLPDLSTPLQTTVIESHTPAQTSAWPALNPIVTRLGLEELNVNVVVTFPPVEFTAVAARLATCPATSESVPDEHEGEHVKVTCATVVAVLLEEPPPHPARTTVIKTAIMKPVLTAQGRMPPPRIRVSRAEC